jgi:DNA sulfur modification protein DndD
MVRLDNSVKLKTLIIKNFMPYKGESSIDFPQDDSKNTLIVFGDNMRGKTSLLNAIRWGFYGYAYGRHLRKIPLNLLPNSEAVKEGPWEMMTQIKFEAQGSQYDLRRIARPKKHIAVIQKAEDIEVELHLQKDGAALSGNLIEEEINQFSPEQVSRFFLFDGELLQEYEELLIEGSDQGKRIKEEIEKVLGVPTLTNGREDSRNILKQAQKLQAIEASKSKELESIAEIYQEQEAKLDSYKSDLEDLEGQLKRTHEDRLSLDDEIEKYESIFVKKVQLDGLRSRQKEIDEDIKSKINERKTLVGEIWKDFLGPRLTLKREGLMEEQQALNKIANNATKVRLLIEQAKEALESSTCPTCGTTIDPEKLNTNRFRLNELKDQLSGFKINESRPFDIAVLMKTINGVLENRVGNRLTDLDLSLSSDEFNLSKIENNIEDLEEELKDYGIDQLQRDKQKRDSLLRYETTTLNNIEQRKTLIEKTETEIRVLSSQLQGTESSRKTRLGQLIAITQKIFSSFDLSVERFRNNLKDSVQRNASIAFKEMTTQAAYSGLKINENYGLTILDQNSNEVQLRSAGAEQIVALSLIAGLSQAGRSSGPVIMDTPFGRLDTKHRKNILKYLPTSATQLVMFVHDGEIRGSEDLEVIASRIGGQYEIKEVSPSHSIIQKR